VCERKRAFCSINGIEDMAGSPFVRVVATYCVLACSLIAMTAAQPCPKNQRLIRNVVCDFLGPVACALNPTMWVQPNRGFPYCDWCYWGEYSDSNNNNAHCTQCPVNTVVTQGRYNTQYNNLVGNWCEEDCGIALRNMIQYPVEKLRIGCNGFCSDMFDVFMDSQSYLQDDEEEYEEDDEDDSAIIGSRRLLQGSDTYAMGIPCVNKGTTCTEADYKIADVMFRLGSKLNRTVLNSCGNSLSVAEKHVTFAQAGFFANRVIFTKLTIFGNSFFCGKMDMSKAGCSPHRLTF
jgi:hypothetical protein